MHAIEEKTVKRIDVAFLRGGKSKLDRRAIACGHSGRLT